MPFRFRVQFAGEPDPRPEEFETILTAEIWAAHHRPGAKHHVWAAGAKELDERA